MKNRFMRLSDAIATAKTFPRGCQSVWKFKTRWAGFSPYYVPTSGVRTEVLTQIEQSKTNPVLALVWKDGVYIMPRWTPAQAATFRACAKVSKALNPRRIAGAMARLLPGKVPSGHSLIL